MKIIKVLTESIDTEALKAFTHDVKVTRRYSNDIVDTDSLIKAIKDEVPTNIWDELFNEYIQLKHKGTYGTIKNSHLPPVIKKALVDYWLFQFKNYSFYDIGKDTKGNKLWSFNTSESKRIEAAKEAAKKAEKEREKEEQIKAWEEEELPKILPIAKKALALINMTKYKEAKGLWNAEFPDNKVVEKPEVVIQREYRRVVISAMGYIFTIKSEGDPKKIADYIDKQVSIEKEKAEVHKGERESKEHVQTNYKDSKWWSPELEAWIAEGKTGKFVFQWPDDDGIQVLNKLDWVSIRRCEFSNDVIFAGAVTSYSPEMRNRYSATESSYHYIYYSVSNEADAMAIDELGVLLDPSKFVDTSSWGEEHYKELTRNQVEKDKDYFKTRMDRWFYYSSESYGSD